MWSRLLLSATPGLAHGFPIPFRRHAADDIAYTAALLIGCLVGVGLAWQLVLSEGARGRIIDRMAGFSTSVRTVVAFEPQPPSPLAPPVQGIPDRRDRPQQYALAMWPETTLQSSANPQNVAAVVATPRAEPVPERLALAEEKMPVAPAPVREESSVVDLEIVFDINSSFLAPAAVTALKGLVSGLPGGRPYQLALRAAVSDDGVKGAKPRDALRYNRWLAERRLDRVAAWLRDHAEVELAIRPAFMEHDASRRVTLSARQLP